MPPGRLRPVPKPNETRLRAVLFTDLKRWVQELPEFDDDPKHCGEKILEAIQMTWMDEGEFDDN